MRRSTTRIAIALHIALALPVSVAIANATERHVAERVPVQGAAREFAAERATPHAVSAIAHIAGAPHAWRLQQVLPGAVVHDIAFPDATTGYAAAELGQLWKTSDGG